jgi:hypothetical protein
MTCEQDVEACVCAVGEHILARELASAAKAYAMTALRILT